MNPQTAEQAGPDLARAAYVSAGLAEMHKALAFGHKVFGWQYGARLPIASVELAPPTEEGWAYLGTGGGGLKSYFTTYEVEATSGPAAEEAAMRWLEGYAADMTNRRERNHALRILSLLPLRSPRTLATGDDQ